MMMNRKENNRVLIEKTLTNVIRQICIRLRLGFHDWDIDLSLREAIEKCDTKDKLQDLIKTYDETFDLATKSNTQIEDKYKAIYKLNKDKKKK